MRERKRRFGLRHDVQIALLLAEFNELDGILELLFQPAAGADRIIEALALPHHRLSQARIVPQFGILGLVVQLIQSPQSLVPVKDASSGAINSP